MQKLHQSPHPITVLLALTWLALEAAVTLARTLLVPALALLFTLADWLTSTELVNTSNSFLLITSHKQKQAPDVAPPPAVHPFAALVEQLTTDHTRRQLQQLAGTRANLTKATLAGMVAACS